MIILHTSGSIRLMEGRVCISRLSLLYCSILVAWLETLLFCLELSIDFMKKEKVDDDRLQPPERGKERIRARECERLG